MDRGVTELIARGREKGARLDYIVWRSGRGSRDTKGSVLCSITTIYVFTTGPFHLILFIATWFREMSNLVYFRLFVKNVANHCSGCANAENGIDANGQG
jgi:hypothetical protein